MKNGLKIYQKEIFNKKLPNKHYLYINKKRNRIFWIQRIFSWFWMTLGMAFSDWWNKGTRFSNKFFEGLNVNTLNIGGKLSPKILIVKPNARLSWQYHNRRAEIWQVFNGSAGIIRSDSDEENEIKVYNEGDYQEYYKKHIIRFKLF